MPLLLGALSATFAPHAARFFASFTGALFTGALPILAVFYVCTGATIDVGALPTVARRGGALLAVKAALGLAAGFLLGHVLHEAPVAGGWFSGLCAPAVVAAVSDTNGGLDMALMTRYGRPEEAAAHSVTTLESGPSLTMVSLGVAGLAALPWQTLVGAVLPLVVGIALGSLDHELRDCLGRATATLIPLLAFALGSTLDLHRVWAAGLLGLALGSVVVLVTGAMLVMVDRRCGGNGTAGIAAASTAGTATAVPALVAAADPAYREAAASATVLVAACVIVSSLSVPVLTAWWAGRVRGIDPA